MSRVAKKDPKIITCPLCGAELACDNRVRVSLQWEFPDVQIWGNQKINFINSKSKSKYICRECATKLSYQIGSPKPKELL